LSAATKAVIVLAAVLGIVAVAWIIFLPAIVQRELRTITGFDFRVEVLKVNPFTGNVTVRGLTASNPAGFPKPEFVELRELHADVNMFSGFSNRIVVNELDINTAKIVLIRQRDGTSNAGKFMAAFSRPAGQAASAAPPSSRTFLVKRLHLRLEELVVVDYSGSKTEEKVYKLNIDQSYTDVTDPKQLLVPSVLRSLYAFGLHHDIAQLLPGDLGEALAGALGGAAHAGSELKGVVQKAGDSLKQAFDKLDHSSKP
jgi:hypothetical protein